METAELAVVVPAGGAVAEVDGEGKEGGGDEEGDGGGFAEAGYCEGS